MGPARRIDLKLPAEIPVRDLFPKLLELCGPQLAQSQEVLSQWLLVLPSREIALPPNRSLRECGIVDGDMLALRNNVSFVAKQQQASTQVFRPQAIQPSADTGGIGVRWNIPNE